MKRAVTCCYRAMLVPSVLLRKRTTEGVCREDASVPDCLPENCSLLVVNDTCVWVLPPPPPNPAIKNLTHE